MISIIIPLLNEESSISQLLTSLSKLQGKFEVIFVDGGSTDNTLDIIQQNTTLINFTLFSSQKGRSIQMNTGAKKAQGDILHQFHLVVMNRLSIIKKMDKSKQSQEIKYLFPQVENLILIN